MAEWRPFFGHVMIRRQVISELASKRSFNDVNHCGDIRTTTCWCVELDNVKSKIRASKISSIFSVRRNRMPLLHTATMQSPDHCAGMAGNFQLQVLIERRESVGLGETTMLQTRAHPRQRQFNDLLGTRKSHAPFAHCYHTMLFIHSSWQTTGFKGWQSSP